MGHIKHHSILVTANDYNIRKVHRKAIEIFNNRTSNVVESDFNLYSSFFIAPDGSKEGWETSDIGDTKRDQFIQWVNDQAYEDGSNYIDFVEVSYGGDERHPHITQNN